MRTSPSLWVYKVCSKRRGSSDFKLFTPPHFYKHLLINTLTQSSSSSMPFSVCILVACLHPPWLIHAVADRRLCPSQRDCVSFSRQQHTRDDRGRQIWQVLRVYGDGVSSLAILCILSTLTNFRTSVITRLVI